MQESKISRMELFNMVWNEPIVSLSKKFDMTESMFRNICKKFDIPLPPMGYWQRVQYGKEINIPLLSESGDQENLIDLKKETGDDSLTSRISIDRLERQLKVDPGLDFKVPSRLVKPDPMIQATELYFKEIQKPYQQRNEGTLRNQHIEINVGKELWGRSLRFMDTLIKLLRARGHDLIIKNSKTYAVIEGESIRIYINEKSKREQVQNKYGRFESVYTSTGLMYLQLYDLFPRFNWIDGKYLLEDQLPRILAKLELYGREHKAERIRIDKYWEDYHEKERIKLEIKKRKEKELDDFKKLLKKAKRWEKAAFLRSFLQAMEEKNKTQSVVSEEFIQWLEWAHKKADWYDPLIEATDDLLKEVDRDELSFKK